ncbi:tetratricopeptide repeat protein, partial [Thiohalocapsa sp. ML1]|uniref:tetratricopeptide repeat protein n=1 Tax=Thiohalocapsa sp. ML1 TaxID=1431688 RepID=UPI000AB91B52
EAARAAFAESLDIRRRILARVGETPEALRDLSVSLDNVGKTDQALGDLEAARAAFAESLDIRRRILARVGETPEALRDLSVSLDNVGKTDQALGDLEAARAAFAEGLELAERLAAALPNHVDYKDLPDWFRRRLAEIADAERARPSDA